MENQIQATTDGTVKKIFVKKGDNVAEGERHGRDRPFGHGQFVNSLKEQAMSKIISVVPNITRSGSDEAIGVGPYRRREDRPRRLQTKKCSRRFYEISNLTADGVPKPE